jgi:hypothetical protein
MLGHFATVSGTVPDRFPALGQAAELVWKVALDWLSSRRVFVRKFRGTGRRAAITTLHDEWEFLGMIQLSNKGLFQEWYVIRKQLEW